MNQKGTKPGGRDVVQVVRISRSVGAAVAACAVLSGCVSGDADEGAPEVQSTSQVIAETQANPWDLPIEQRPDLFDPCAEIPVEAVRAEFGSTVEPDEVVHHNRRGELHACGWKNDEILLGVVGTWLPRDGFLADQEFTDIDTDSVFLGRPGIRAADRSDKRYHGCYQIFFTSRGAVVVNVNLLTALRKFRGERSAKACDVLDQTIGPIVELFPPGDF